jgi:hypothetical protein
MYGERVRVFSLASVIALIGAVACGDDVSIPSPPDVPPAPGVAGPAWWSFARDPQHTAVGAVASQDLNRIAWLAPLDLAPQQTNGELLVHYGSPVVTSFNTVILPVKTGAAGGFRIEARSGVNGGLIWSADSDYVLPPHDWLPSYNLALTSSNSLYAPASGGKLLARDQADSEAGTVRSLVFYGAANYAANPAAYDGTVFIDTPITIDSAGNAFFGFRVTGANPANLVGGIARIDASGAGGWVAASGAANDSAVAKAAMNSAPALSADQATLYVAVNADAVQKGYLVALDSTTLAVKSRVLLRDPTDGQPALVSDDATASPTVGPDGDVFFGVQEAVAGTHNGRGWLLHFDAGLTIRLVPGAFGWDDTASVVPASMVPSYGGTSSYLLMTKYNNYADSGSGDGQSRLAVLDPKASQTDPISGKPVMVEVLTLLGPTFESGSSGPVKEWCINTAAVDPLTGSVLVNSADGFLYRWDLSRNAFTQRIQLTSGIGEAYTPTAIGADGAVYAVSNAVLFSIAK